MTSSLSPWKPPVASSTARARISSPPATTPHTRPVLDQQRPHRRVQPQVVDLRRPVRVQRVDVGAVGDAEAEVLRPALGDRHAGVARRGHGGLEALDQHPPELRIAVRQQRASASRRPARSTESRRRNRLSRRSGQPSRTRSPRARARPRPRPRPAPPVPRPRPPGRSRAHPRNVTVVASLSDISRHAGVSIATCSRVLNGSAHPVSEATRTRVLDAAQELGLRAVSALARALVTRSSRIIGVIVGDIVDPYFAEIARGVEEVGADLGYLTMVCSAEAGSDAELGHLRQLRDYHAAGIVFAAQRAQQRPERARARRRRRRRARPRLGGRRARQARLRRAQHRLRQRGAPRTTSRPTSAASATSASRSSRARPACTRARCACKGFQRAGGTDRVPGGFSYEDGLRAADMLLARDRAARTRSWPPTTRRRSAC